MIQLTPEEVEHVWLSKIFKIDSNNQVMNDRMVDFIPKDKRITVQYLIDELCYSFLTCA